MCELGQQQLDSPPAFHVYYCVQSLQFSHTRRQFLQITLAGSPFFYLVKSQNVSKLAKLHLFLQTEQMPQLPPHDVCSITCSSGDCLPSPLVDESVSQYYIFAIIAKVLLSCTGHIHIHLKLALATHREKKIKKEPTNILTGF